MLLNRKAQSTAEYAITIGLVIAVATGILQVALKGGIRQKNKQSLNYLLNAGNTTDFDLTGTADEEVQLFSQDYRKTTVDSGDYIDERIMERGGAEKRMQQQSTVTNAVSVETIDAVN